MSFEPSGGYPPLLRKSMKNTNTNNEDLVRRAFASMNIVNISNIFNKPKDVPFFDMSEDGYTEDSIFFQQPEQYESIRQV